MIHIDIVDSTLRDGAQADGIAYSLQDKLNIIKILDDFGVSYIEAGNPASNPKDTLLFEKTKEINISNAKLVAFGSTIKRDSTPEKDEGMAALLSANTPCVSVFGKAWKLHVAEILNITEDDNLAIIHDTIKYLKENDKEVIFDAEHFFDGFKDDACYAYKVIDAAYSGGADTVCLCDTNGGSMPHEIEKIVKNVVARYSNTQLKFGIHCHDDGGCAVANSVIGVQNGVTQVQGTFIGFGERCGNANLSAVIPNLMLKCGYTSLCKLSELRKTAREISEIANVRLNRLAPYVGKSAFSHKGGMHIDAVYKNSRSFEHINPETVGNERRFLISESSGRSTIYPRLQQYLPGITKTSPEVALITKEVKEKELSGYQYEAADASFELMLKKSIGMWKPHFKIIMYKVTDDFPAPDGEQQANAMIKVEVNGKTEMACASGNGPVNALDKALRTALSLFFPELHSMQLVDYKVRVIDSRSTESLTRVVIESCDKNTNYSTVGVSEDIIEASLLALADSVEFKLSRNQ